MLHILKWISREYWEEFNRKICLIPVVSAVLFIFPGTWVHGSDFLERSIPTTGGEYSIQIASPSLSRLKKVRLFDFGTLKFPKLPDWREEAESPGFTLLPDDKDLYQEGLALYNSGSFRNSLEEFDELVLEYPESQFFQASLFWKSQILIRLKKYDEALDILEKIVIARQYSDYLFRSAHTFIWLTIQQGQLKKALDVFDQYSLTIFTPLSLGEILPLKVYAHLKQNQLAKGLETLIKLQKGFPENTRYFENAVKIAELYHLSKQWDQIHPLVESVWKKYSNHPLMEKLLYIGISGDLQRNDWGACQKKLDWVHEKKAKESDRFAQGYFYFHLWQNHFEQARNWLDQFSNEKLQKINLRQLIQYAYEQKQFEFLADSHFSNQLLQDWGSEAYWILGDVHEQLKQSEFAYVEYQKALSYARSPEIQETLSFNLAAVELLLKNFDKAVDRINQMLVDFRQSPNKPEFLFWYGVAQDQLGSKIALPYLKQVKIPSERADDSLYYLIRYYHNQKLWNRVNEYFLRLTKDFPDTPFLGNAYFYQADAFYQGQLFDEARILLEEWKRDHQGLVPVEMTELWTRVLVELGRFEEAKELLQQVKAEEYYFKLIQLKVQVLVELKHHEDIMQFVTSSLKQSLEKSQKEFLYFNRAESAFALHKDNEAILDYQKTLDHHVLLDQRIVYYQLARLAIRTENYPVFLEMSRLVLDGPSDKISNNILNLLSDYYSGLKEKEKEKFYLNRLANNYEVTILNGNLSNLDEALLTFELAKVKNKLGLFQEASKLLDRTIALQGSEVSFEVFREKGNADFENRQFETAISSYLKLIYFDTEVNLEEKFDLLNKIAYSYEQLNKYEEAKIIYQKMLKDFQDEKRQSQVRKNLGRLENVSRETKE
ncbi:MAG: tetratricopeptide repeat protein [SAR324 cluster bacterium]|nr:tetratricopeptide repeat protein [SAR324 cluster bacterium]